MASTHVLGETTADVVAEGLAVARQLSVRTGVELVGVMAPVNLAGELTVPEDLELFPLYRMLRPRRLSEEREPVRAGA